MVFLDEDEPQQFGGTFSGVVYILIFALSLVGNSFLLWALLTREDLRKTTTLFLLQLAVSDLLLTLSLPFWAVYHLHEWVFGRAGCHLLVFFFYLGFYGYMAFLAAVTVDRYLAVVHAMRVLRLRSGLCVWLTSASLWLVCVAASIPEAVHSETNENGTECAATPQPLHLELLGYAIQIGLFFLLPFVLILFCYARIWATVLRCKSRRRYQMVWLIFLMVAGFFACWTPYNVVLILDVFKLLGSPALRTFRAEENMAYAYYVCHTLAYCHCFLNPALHIFGSGRFRGYLHSHRGRSLTVSSQNGARRSSASYQTGV